MSKKLATALHLLLCKKSHNDHECNWYVETQQAEQWEKPSHSEWLKKADNILQLSGQPEEKLEELLGRLMGIVGQLSYLKERHPTLREVIDTIILEATNKPITTIRRVNYEDEKD